MGHGGRDLHAVGVTQHVPDERDAAHAGEGRAPRELREASRSLEALRAVDDHLPDVLAVVPQAALVAVRAEDGRQAALLPLRPEEKAGDEVAREALERDLLDREVGALDAA